MQELIKEMRERLKYSQGQLAKALGVSPITVSRWENGKAKPSVLAQRQLFEICVNSQLNMADYIVAREKKNADETSLYHASRKGIVGDISPISRSKCDFGKGV